jgi:hypothetical protein
MLKKIFGASVLAAVTLLGAHNSYKVPILQDTTIAGNQIKAGDYKVEVQGGNAILKHGKEYLTVAAHVEQAQSKYPNTQVQYVNQAIHEIHIGGSTTKIVFAPGNGGAGSVGEN